MSSLSRTQHCHYRAAQLAVFLVCSNVHLGSAKTESSTKLLYTICYPLLCVFEWPGGISTLNLQGRTRIPRKDTRYAKNESINNITDKTDDNKRRQLLLASVTR